MPDDKQRFRLLHGPYRPPPVDVGDTVKCFIYGSATVCGWSEGRIPWPMIRVGHGGKGAYLMTPELARAIRTESELAICHWFGMGSATVSKWRRRFGVEQFNDGTLRLWSLWKEPKLPDQAVAFSPAALRTQRLKRGLTHREVAEAMGWTNLNSYQQMESGRRRRATLPTLGALASVFRCSVEALREGDARQRA